MLLGDKRLVFILFGLAILVVQSDALQRIRRILNEPGDVSTSGKNYLPFLKRQQIIYLLNNKTNRHASTTPKQMENYAKELTPDGKVLKPHANKFYSSEDFHGGGVQEIDVNKGDGPPSLNKQTNIGVVDKKEPSPTEDKKLFIHASNTQATVSKAASTINKGSETSVAKTKDTSDANKKLSQDVDVNASKKSDYPTKDDPNAPRTTSTRSKLFRYADGELVLPVAPKQIDPNIYDIGQGDIRDSPRHFRRLRFREDGGAYVDEPVRRWRGRGRPRRRFYSRRGHRPFVLDRRPNVLLSPMYGNSPPVLSYQSAPMAPGMMPPPAPYRSQVMMQPMPQMQPMQPLPVMSSSQQPVLQSPIVQQASTRSVLYNVPVQSGQLPQPVVYPIIAVPTMAQPQQFVQVQPGIQPLPRLRATHYADEQGHARSEEPPRPPSDFYDDDRHYSDRYMYRNERPFFRERDDDDDEEDDEYPRRRPYMEENADARSEQPFLPPAVRPSDDDDEQGDDDDEVDAYQQDLLDSKEDSIPGNSPPEIEDDGPPGRNIVPFGARNGRRPIIEIPSSRVRNPARFMYPMSTDTFTREQLLRSPLAQGALPRFSASLFQRNNMQPPQSEMSEMSADEARFRERMRLELQAKDTIPRGVKSSNDGLKNVFIRVNGRLLENASELRSRIVHGRYIPGHGKTIRSKGPMKIRVSHRGKGKHKIKIIDIFTPKRFNVVDSRSKIMKAPSIVKKTVIKHNSNINNGIKGLKAIFKRPLKNKPRKSNKRKVLVANLRKRKSSVQKHKLT